MKFMRLVFLGMLLTMSGCSERREEAQEEPSRTEYHEADAGHDIIIESIENTSGEVVLSLTHDYVALQLSPSALEEISKDFDEAREEKSESQVVNRIKDTILDRIERLLSSRLKYAVDSIDRITWDDGQMVFTLNSGEEAWDSIFVGGDSVLETFREEDALRFIEQFELLKQASD